MRLALLKRPLGPGIKFKAAHALGSRLDRSPYSHGELVFTDHVSGSSWLRGGVQLRQQTEHYYDPSKWDFWSLPWRLEAPAREWFEANHLKIRYDTLGCVRFAIGFVDHDKAGMYCHEAIGTAVGLIDPWRNAGGGILAQARKHWNSVRLPSAWGSGLFDDAMIPPGLRTMYDGAEYPPTSQGRAAVSTNVVSPP